MTRRKHGKHRWALVSVSGLSTVATVATVAASLGGGACGSNTQSNGFDAGGGDGGAKKGGDATSDMGLPDTLRLVEAGSDSGKMGKDSSPSDAGPGVVAVYAESPDTLYSLDPSTNAITVVGPFNGDCTSESANGDSPIPGCTTDCCDVTDLALDESSNAYVTTFNALYSLDLKTATTKLISKGSYPNSLSFVPKGTLDPSEEALVGYNGATYVRIETSTGVVTDVGALTGGYTSSGDIVSVIGGGTFLTVTGASDGGVDCSATDCLLQVDPKTGDLIQNYGTIAHEEVYGIAFWAGTVYGFDDMGQVFSISYSGGTIVTTPITVPSPPANLEFWGAGSTTSAPTRQTDGGGIPIK
jgi:hypothetical protein